MLLTSRPALLADTEEIALLLAEMYFESGRARLNAQKTWTEIQDSIHNHAVYLVEHDDRIVASIALHQLPGGLFYSDEPFLVDKWFYARPDYRPKNLHANAFKLLLEETQILVDSIGIPALISVFNGSRHRRGSKIAQVGERLCIFPAGAIVEILPEGPPDVGN